jgi:hypothetical protein
LVSASLECRRVLKVLRMGVEVNIWRARIGAFVGKKLCASVGNNGECDNNTKSKCQYELGLIIGILLIIAGVELNPGPLTSDDIKQIVAALQPQFDEVNKKQSELIQQELSNVRHTMDEFKTCCTSQYKEMKEEIANLKERNEELLDMVNTHENAVRKNNIIIHGVEEKDTISAEQVVTSICAELGVTVNNENIAEAFRIGRNKGKRPIVCKLNTFKKKKEIIDKSRGMTSTPYYITHDLSKQEREAKQKLRKYREYAISQNLTAYIRGTKLIINGQAWTHDELQDYFDNEIGGSEQIQSNNHKRNQKERTTVETDGTANIARTATTSGGAEESNLTPGRNVTTAADKWPKPGPSTVNDEQPVAMEIQQEKTTKRSYSRAVKDTPPQLQRDGDMNIIKKINKNLGSLMEKSKSPPKRGKIISLG